jgi:hypothetical protein
MLTGNASSFVTVYHVSWMPKEKMESCSMTCSGQVAIEFCLTVESRSEKDSGDSDDTPYRINHLVTSDYRKARKHYTIPFLSICEQETREENEEVRHAGAGGRRLSSSSLLDPPAP